MENFGSFFHKNVFGAATNTWCCENIYEFNSMILKIFFIGFYQLVQLQYLRTGSGNVGNVSAGARTPASIAAACNQASSFGLKGYLLI